MTGQEHIGEAAEGRPRPRGRWAARRLWRAAALALGLPLVFAVVAALMLIGRDVSAPSWVVEEVEARAAALTGGELSVGRIAVTLGGDLHPRVRLTDAVLRDARGTEVARIPRVDALISPRGVVLQRALLVQRIEIAGAVIALDRGEDGRVAVSFGIGPDPAETATAAEAPDLAGLLSRLDRATARAELSALEEIAAEGLVVNYADARAGRSWTVDDGRIAVGFGREELEIAADLSLMSGLAEPTTLSARYVSPRGSAAAELSLAVEQAVAADLATQSAALSWLAVLDAPLSANLRAVMDEAGEVSGLDAVLTLGAGALRPNTAASPVPFEAARTYLAFDPGEGALRFDLIEIDSAAGTLEARGRAYLRDVEDGLPQKILGQFDVTRAAANPGGLYAAPLRVTEATADLRLELAPFRLTIAGGRALLGAPEGGDATEILGGARVWTGPEGWHVAADAEIGGIAIEEALAFWPVGWRPGVRRWLAGNLLEGELADATVALRAEPGRDLMLATDFAVSGGRVQFLPRMPPVEGVEGFVEIVGRSFAVSLDAGRVVAPGGGALDLAGSTMVIPVMGLPGSVPAEFGIEAEGPIPALLSVLDRPPLGLMARAGLADDVATGRARVSGRLFVPLTDDLRPEAVSYVMGAELTEVDAPRLIPERRLTADRLDVAATPEGVEIAGRARVDGVPVEGSFRKPFTQGTPAVVEAGVSLSAATLETFGIALPAGVVTGTGEGLLTLRLPAGEAPDFSLVSTLQGMRLSLPWIGWGKPAGDPGAFEIAGTLGRDPQIDRLSLSAGGLEARGRIDLGPGGTFQAARFDRLTVGSWLDAPVTLRSRGDGRPVAVDMPGGRLDLRRARFGAGDTQTGAGGPLSIVLDRLQVTDTLALTDFVGAFRSEGGLAGSFTALVNDGPEIQGSLVPWQGRTGVRLTSQDGGAVLRAAELLPNATGGGMELILQPTGGEGSFNGSLRMTDLRVRDAPAMAALLDAVSVVGLLQQLDGQGLSFAEVDARFRMSPEAIVVTAASAVGPSLGVSLDGTYGMTTQVMDFQGVVSPLYLLNGIGSVLTRPGEGLIGFNFRLGGTVGRPQVQVNPLSVLTPGMFREIFRRPPPQVGQ